MSRNPWWSIATAVVILIAVCVVPGCFPGSESPHQESPQPKTSQPKSPTPESPQPQTPSHQTTATGWPNWMGPNYDGVSKEKGWSSTWPEDGLTKIWERQIGIGFSSISIADNRLFSMGHVDGKEFVYSLNPDTGHTIWKHSYDSPLVDNLHEGGPGATPTIDGDFVYSLGRGGQLSCLRAKGGDVVWSKMLQDDLDVLLPEWGFTSSPFILGDQLILEAGRVVSYSKTSGKKNWQTDRHNAGYGSAASFTHQGTDMIATLDCDALRIVRSSNGKLVDTFEWASPFRTNSTTPIARGDRIYISTGYQVGCGLFKLENNKLELVYENRQMRNHFNNSILVDGHLYGFDGNSNLGRVVQLTCMDFDTGKVAWKQRGFGCGSLMVADGKLLILTEDGDLVLAEATPEQFTELARSPFLDGRCWTVPVLLEGRVYGRNAAGKLVCVQLPKTE